MSQMRAACKTELHIFITHRHNVTQNIHLN